MASINSDPKVLTNKEKVYETLKQRIINGVYSPGRQIRIFEVAKELGLSQTPVREALIQLSAEDLIDFEPYKGAVVKGLSKDEVREIFIIRVILECSALKYAIGNMKEEDFETAFNILMKGKEIDDPAVISEINWEFHTYLYNQSGLPRLCGMINSFRSQVDRYLRIYYSFSNVKDFIKPHLEILEACKAKDTEKATNLLEENIYASLDVILKFLAL